MLTVLVATIKNLIVVCSPHFVADFKGSSNLWFDSKHAHLCVCVRVRACMCVCVCVCVH